MSSCFVNHLFVVCFLGAGYGRLTKHGPRFILNSFMCQHVPTLGSHVSRVTSFSNMYHRVFDHYHKNDHEILSLEEILHIEEKEMSDKEIKKRDRDLADLHDLQASLKALSEKDRPPFCYLEIIASSCENAYPISILRKISELCSETRVPLVSDEVMTSIRCGHAFAYQAVGIDPSYVCIGKTLVPAVLRPTTVSRPKKVYPFRTNWGLVSSFQALSVRQEFYTRDQLQRIFYQGQDVRTNLETICAYNCTHDSVRGVGFLLFVSNTNIEYFPCTHYGRILPPLSLTSSEILRTLSSVADEHKHPLISLFCKLCRRDERNQQDGGATKRVRLSS